MHEPIDVNRGMETFGTWKNSAYVAVFFILALLAILYAVNLSNTRDAARQSDRDRLLIGELSLQREAFLAIIRDMEVCEP
jgi:hypothetical protein